VKEIFSRLFLALSANLGLVEREQPCSNRNRGDQQMNSTERLACALIPPLRQPKPETADRGAVRLGAGCITAAFPPLRQPKPETADRGAVRLGAGCITAAFPPLRQPKPETADRGAVRLGAGCITAAFPPRR
jgi:hypothetical protein